MYICFIKMKDKEFFLKKCFYIFVIILMGFKYVCIDKIYIWYYVIGIGWIVISIWFIIMEVCDWICE